MAARTIEKLIAILIIFVIVGGFTWAMSKLDKRIEEHQNTQADPLKRKFNYELVELPLGSRKLQCIQSPSSLTCNWDKLNKEIEQCLIKRKEERGAFPGIKGECL